MQCVALRALTRRIRPRIRPPSTSHPRLSSSTHTHTFPPKPKPPKPSSINDLRALFSVPTISPDHVWNIFKSLHPSSKLLLTRTDYDALVALLGTTSYGSSRAVEFIPEMRNAGFVPTPSTYRTLTSKSKFLLPAPAATRLLAEMQTDGVSVDIGIATDILASMSNRAPRECVAMFHRLCPPTMSVPESTFAWLLQSAVLRRLGKANEVLGIMEERGVGLTSVTFNAILERLLPAFNWSPAEINHMKLFGSVIPPFRCVDGYGNLKRFANRDVDRAVELFGMLCESGAAVTEETYDIVVRGLCANGRPKQARRCIDEMRSARGWMPSKEACYAYMEAAVRSGELAEAEHLFDDPHLALRHDYEASEILLKGICKHGTMEAAEAFFAKMDGSPAELRPRVDAYAALMEVWAEKGDPARVMGLLTSMCAANVAPDAACIRCTVMAYLNAGQVEAAAALIYYYTAPEFVESHAQYDADPDPDDLIPAPPPGLPQLDIQLPEFPPDAFPLGWVPYAEVYIALCKQDRKDGYAVSLLVYIISVLMYPIDELKHRSDFQEYLLGKHSW
ncbi:hypothetical protein BDK51DRAFT_40940 [Blyttiomyces helicus]|uniref:Pentacotripeptide-repeat region of PRORP domain-containing protein n=1 Tax=Blyttiomyces helicus TaxID=388810 RepID=A0A4P9W0B3_9FUNG|nr:hypothetical protein BDK51DRAFT_40940 [Blyttiomyces helicus]|eukprot:RKO83456.1 hypothetical protein BDK51DRAFT_40940 [Blyttiomyces helicus]